MMAFINFRKIAFLSTIFIILHNTIAAISYTDDCYWLRTEYLGWIIKDQSIPIPLVTTASFADALPGAIGQPGTRIVLGNSHQFIGWQNGFQINAGARLNDQLNSGIETTYFLLPKATRNQSLGTSGLPGSPNFAVPIFDVTGVFGLNGIPGETVFILPGPLFGDPGFEGLFNLSLSSKFQGAELNGLWQIEDSCNLQFEGLAGFRWVQLEESLSFTGKTQTISGVAFPGFYNFEDHFATLNNFYGVQTGLKTVFSWCNFSFEAALKGGVGVSDERVIINGVSQTSGGNLFFSTSGTAHELLSGGIFSQLTNIGTYRKQEAAGLFETCLRGSYDITESIEVSIGYTFLWLSHVVRPGNQLNRKINPTLTALANASRETVGTGPGPIPFGEPGPAPAASGPSEPREMMKSTDFWAQGLTLGLMINF